MSENIETPDTPTVELIKTLCARKAIAVLSEDVKTALMCDAKLRELNGIMFEDSANLLWCPF